MEFLHDLPQGQPGDIYLSFFGPNRREQQIEKRPSCFKVRWTSLPSREGEQIWWMTEWNGAEKAQSGTFIGFWEYWSVWAYLSALLSKAVGRRLLTTLPFLPKNRLASWYSEKQGSTKNSIYGCWRGKWTNIEVWLLSAKRCARC